MKDELARAVITTPSEVAAEVSATLRFAGGLHLVGGRILVEAELDSPVAARRLRTYLQALYNAESSVVVVSGSSLRRGKRYVVRVVRHCRGRRNLARCVPRPRLAHGTRTFLLA